MAINRKHNETRSWPTSYRGPLLICSAQRRPSREEAGDDATYEAAMKLPYGCGLCVVEVYDCVPSADFHNGKRTLSKTEAELGDYSPDRWIWMTRNLRPLKTPLPIRGRQGLWTLTPEEVAAVNASL